METSAPLGDGISVFIPSPTTFATITTNPAAAPSTMGLPALESSIVDYYLTNTDAPWAVPTTIPAINYDDPDDPPSSNDNTSSQKFPPWAISVLVMVIMGLIIIIFVLWRRKVMKAQYAEAIKTEPRLTWEAFKKRCKERARDADLSEEYEDREAWRRSRERAKERRAAFKERTMERRAAWALLEVKPAKVRRTGNGNEPDGEILLHSMEGRHHDEESGRSDFDDSAPPPYSSVVEPGSDIGVVGVAW
jgi:hypothetical protein